MDRLYRSLTGCGLVLLLAAGGCRSTQPEVPPGRPYTNDGRQVPPIGFSSEPHGMTGPGMTAGMPGLAAGPGSPQLGTPGAAASTNYGAPTNSQYAAPAYTAGVAPVPSTMGQLGGGAESTSMPSSGLGAPSIGTMAGPAAAPAAPTLPAGSPALDPGAARAATAP
jgi:hypothetical protein